MIWGILGTPRAMLSIILLMADLHVHKQTVKWR